MAAIEPFDLSDPVRAGQLVVYSITIKNDRNASDKSVALIVTFPEGLAFKRTIGPQPTLR